MEGEEDCSMREVAEMPFFRPTTLSESSRVAASFST